MSAHITDEAVEAAARSIEACLDLSISLGTLARAALEAAAPHMLAEAWEAGWDRLAEYDRNQQAPYPTNPYRPAK